MSISRRAWTAALIVSVLLALIALVLCATPREPSYNGKLLSAWVTDLESSDPKKHAEAETAIKQMGPRAVPFLSSSVSQRNSLALQFYRSKLFPTTWGKSLRARIPWHQPVLESRNAANALAVLGRAATNAIPELIPALGDPSPLVAGAAYVALAKIGAPAVPALREVVQTKHSPEAVWAIRALAGIGPDAAPAARDVAKFLEAPAPDGDFAAMALGQMGPAAARYVTNLVHHTNKVVRLRAISYIERLGPPGVFATNMLFSTVNDPDPRIRQATLVALWTVRPPIEETRPIWTHALEDPDPQSAAIALNALSFDEVGLRAASNKILPLASNPDRNLATAASNYLSMFKLWPKKEAASNSPAASR